MPFLALSIGTFSGATQLHIHTAIGRFSPRRNTGTAVRFRAEGLIVAEVACSVELWGRQLSLG
jgi:hypothetical protein